MQGAVPSGIVPSTPNSTISQILSISEEAKQIAEKALSTFVYEQRMASDVWTVVHNLDKYPAVCVVDSAGTVVIGDIDYTSKNEVVVTFSSEFSGKIFLN